jgi:hypothetical protein
MRELSIAEVELVSGGWPSDSTVAYIAGGVAIGAAIGLTGGLAVVGISAALTTGTIVGSTGVGTFLGATTAAGAFGGGLIRTIIHFNEQET